MSTESSTDNPGRGAPRGRLASVLAFLRRHHRFVTFVSAAAVLGAFLLKDVVREDTKELLDAIEGAQRDFRVASDMTLVNMRVGQTAQMEATMGSGLFDVDQATLQGDSKLAEALFIIEIDSAQWQLDDFTSSMNNLNTIRAKFPKTTFASGDQKLKELYDTIGKSLADLYKLNQHILALKEKKERIDWLVLEKEAQPIFDIVYGGNGHDSLYFQVAEKSRYL